MVFNFTCRLIVINERLTNSLKVEIFFDAFVKSKQSCILPETVPVFVELNFLNSLHFLQKNIIMDQRTILQSNLLDILFDNRNKEYGAYTLRRSYNKRLRIALLSMVTSSLLLCFLFLNRPATVLNLHRIVFSIPETKTFNYNTPSRPQPRAAVSITHSKKANRIELPPRIVDSININTFSATPIETTPSSISADSSGISYEPGGEGNGSSSVKGIQAWIQEQ